MQIFKKYWYTIFVVLLFGGILFINYFDVFKFNYYVPPGNDPVTHVTITKEILQYGRPLNLGYPPGFHYIVAGLSKISGTDPVKTMVYFYPFLMFLSALAVYFFGRQIFGKAVGILSLFLYGFLSFQPRQTLWDGGFPNLMGADFLMVLGFLYFLKAYKNERLKDVFCGGLFLGLVSFFHHLSTYLMIVLLILLIISLLILNAIQKGNLKKKGFILSLTLFIAFLIGAYPAYIYFGKEYLKAISSVFIVYAASLEKFIQGVSNLNPDAPAPPLGDYSLIISPFLWFLGFLALPFLLRGFLKDKKAEYLFIFVWLSVVFIFSRPIAFSPLPGRFARELAIPLTFCSAIFLKEIFVFFKDFWPRLILGLLMIIVILKGLFGLSDWVGKYNHMVFIRDLDKQALEWVKENTEPDSKFAVVPYNCWFGLLSKRSFSNLGTNLDKISQYDYLYVNRWQEGYMWGKKEQYLKIREVIKQRGDLKLIKNFGEENERGIAIYKIGH